MYAAPPQMINSSLRNANAQTRVARVLAPFLLLQCLVRSDAPPLFETRLAGPSAVSRPARRRCTCHLPFLDVLVEQLQWMDATTWPKTQQQ